MTGSNADPDDSKSDSGDDLLRIGRPSRPETPNRPKTPPADTTLPEYQQPLIVPPINPSPPQPTQPQPQPADKGKDGQPVMPKDSEKHHCTQAPRNLILCFDGTGNKFGMNSNVVRFFVALEKSNTQDQICYYQPGIGTYTKHAYITRTAGFLACKFDEAFARGLDGHVKDGYTFLMRNYRKGDKINLFGFSRGAYTARALSGMLYKVGLLPLHNDQQVDFAYTVYNTGGKEGAELGRKFKRTFASDIRVNFIGVWDTVSSVGLIPRTLPHSTYNDGVDVFRHALALDEARARFRPSIWGEPVEVREQLEDVPNLKQKDGDLDEWEYVPPGITDVLEVWFAGCHADVGGGSHKDELPLSLSHISLRWMIKECIQLETGIKFIDDVLLELGFDLRALDPKNIKTPSTIEDSTPTGTAASVPPKEEEGVTRALIRFAKDHTDVAADLYNQLILVPWWWIIECIPTLATYQTPDGHWVRRRWRNAGKGRILPYNGGVVKVHRSVQRKMDASRKARDPKFHYTPYARNWSDSEKMIDWVD